MTHTTPTEAAAQRMISPYVFAGIPQHIFKKPTMQQISERFCELVRMPWEQVIEKTRTKNIITNRQALIFLLRFYTDNSLHQIASFLGGFDHTTIVSNCAKVRQIRAVDVEYRQWIDYLESHIKTLRKYP